MLEPLLITVIRIPSAADTISDIFGLVPNLVVVAEDD
jgi:hypothetical protein